MARVELQTLGGLKVLVDGAPVKLPTRKHYGLLVYLAMNPGKLTHRDQIAELLWSDTPLRRARHSLTQSLYQLRNCLPGLETLKAPRQIGLTEPAVDADAMRLRTALQQNDVAQVERLWRGDFLAGFWISGEPAFEHWQETTRDELRNATANALRSLLFTHVESHDWYAAERTATRLLELDPLDQDVHAARIRSIVAMGDVARARAEYRTTTTMLREKKAVYVRSELTALEARLTAPPDPQRGAPGIASESPFVGRSQELQLLKDHWESLQGESGSAVAVLGEAGIGKTRLCQHFLGHCQLDGARLIHCHAHSTEQWIPYSGIAEGLDQAISPEDLQHLEPIWKAAIRQLLPETVELKPEPGPSQELPELDDDASLRRLHESVVRLLQILCSASPVVLHIDDFHWADRATSTLVHYLIRRSLNMPLLILLSLRPEDVIPGGHLDGMLEDCVKRGWLSRIQLGRLPSPTTTELIQRFCREAELDLDSALRRQIATQMGGHPFFVLETLKTLQREFHAKDPAIRSARLAESGHTPAIPLPTTVQAMLKLRLKQLPEPARHTASALAVLGRAAPANLAHRISGVPEREFIDAVETLVHRGICQDSEGTLRFTHDLIRETAYGQLSDVRRRFFHRQAAHALKDTGESPGHIANHFAQAGESAPAFQHAVPAADQSDSVYAYRETEHFLRIAIRHSPTTQAATATRKRLAATLVRLRRYSEAVSLYEELQAELPDDRVSSPESLDMGIRLADAREKVGLLDWESLRTELSRLHALAEKDSDPGLIHRILRVFIRAANNAGQGDVAMGLIPRIRQIGESRAAPQVRASALMLAAQQLTLYVSAREGASCAERALKLAQAHMEPGGVIDALHMTGIASYARGDLQSAARHFDQGLHLVSETGAVEQEPLLLNQRAVVYQEIGDYENARECYHRIIDLTHDSDSPRDRVIAYANLSAVALACQEYHEAERLSHLILEIGPEPSTWWSVPAAHGVLGSCALEEGHMARAEGHRKDLLAAMDGRDFWAGDFSIVEVFIARIGWLQGRRKQAQERLERAIDSYRHRDFFCSSRLELQLAVFLLSSDKMRASGIAKHIHDAAVANGARPLAIRAEEVMDMLRFRK